MARLKSIKFSRTPNVEFVKVLKERVASYFDERKLSKRANSQMVIKTVLMLLLYLVPYVLIITGWAEANLTIMAMWTAMAFGMVGIGMGIMHDACHGSYSKHPTMNRILGYLLNATGGSTYIWKIQHNVLHHSFTNIEGHDGDIDARGLLRLSPNTKRHGFHRVQAFYAWFIYGLTTINWAISKDLIQIFKYRKKGLTGNSKRKFLLRVTRMSIAKVVYFLLVLGAPMWLSPAHWWVTLLFFVGMHLIAGLVSTSVFQAAHVVPNAEYPVPNIDGKMDESWFVHQMRTTCNFAPKNRFLSWFIGGLNFQIEHHLFPNVSHVHYKNLSAIVRSTAKEFGIPYHVYSSFHRVLWEHTKHLWRLGKKEALINPI